MDTIQAIILGIVEGITEYIPVSSTGHLILAKSMMGLKGDAIDPYLIVIQGGAILAVLGLYRKRVRTMIQGLFGQNAIGLKLAINITIAFMPAAIFGFLFDDMIESALFSPGPVVGALFIGGIIMLFASKWQRKAFQQNDEVNQFIDIEHLTWKRALIIGLLQCLAMWPGTSRSMMTIIGSMAVGMRPKHAAEFSFLLGLPTLGGATIFKLVKDSEALSTLAVTPMLIGILVAFISAAIAIKWLIAYLSKHGLALFGWYRIVLACIVAIGMHQGYFTFEGNNSLRTHEGGEISSVISEPSTLEIVHWLALPVAIQETPSTITGPTTDCQ